MVVIRFLHRLVRSDRYDESTGLSHVRESAVEVESADASGWSYIVWLREQETADERVARFLEILRRHPIVKEATRAGPTMIHIRTRQASHERVHVAAAQAWVEAGGDPAT
jgi:hypothetical protein